MEAAILKNLVKSIVPPVFIFPLKVKQNKFQTRKITIIIKPCITNDYADQNSGGVSNLHYVELI
jgi:hypothetical protein